MFTGISDSAHFHGALYMSRALDTKNLAPEQAPARPAESLRLVFAHLMSPLTAPWRDTEMVQVFVKEQEEDVFRLRYSGGSKFER